MRKSVIAAVCLSAMGMLAANASAATSWTSPAAVGNISVLNATVSGTSTIFCEFELAGNNDYGFVVDGVRGPQFLEQLRTARQLGKNVQLLIDSNVRVNFSPEDFYMGGSFAKIKVRGISLQK